MPSLANECRAEAIAPVNLIPTKAELGAPIAPLRLDHALAGVTEILILG